MLITLHRVVYHDPPTRDDFLSEEARGRATHEPPERRRGLSVWDKPAGARGLAKWQIRRGFVQRAYVAAVRVDEGGPFRAEPSPPPRGHWTLWGDPDQLAAAAWIVERLEG